MLKEITHICKDFEKRAPGSKGEEQACVYMADVLKRTAAATVRTLNPSRNIPAHSTAGFTSL